MAAAMRVVIAGFAATWLADRFEKFDFTDRLQLLGAIFSIAVVALDGDGRNHVVAATQIDE